MTKGQRFSLTSITASAFVVWLFIVTQVQPNKSDTLMMVTFFASFVIWLGSLFAFVFYQLRVRQGNREVIFAHMFPSARQGFAISLTLGVLLYLQLLRVLSLWDALLVIGVAFLFEMALRHNTPVHER